MREAYGIRKKRRPIWFEQEEEQARDALILKEKKNADR